MNEKDFAPLSAVCVRNLNDKLYEKRKAGALEVEKLIREYAIAKQPSKIKHVLKILGDDFALSQYPNARKGGVIGLAATAIALGKDSSSYVDQLVKPVLASFTDQDSRVRYYACEALYNIVKVCRGFVLPYFNEIFDGLSKLTADPDQNVKNGTELLDRLIKDIVTESPNFDLKAFIPLLRERVYAKNPESRQFIVSWIAVLDAVPDINMLVLLPDIIDGLFQILGDKNSEIRKMCQGVLSEFLEEIKRTRSEVRYEGIANILILHCHSDDDLIQCTAMLWLREFILQADRVMIQYIPGMLNAILPCLQSNQNLVKRNVSDAAKMLNTSLKNLIGDDDDLPSPLLNGPRLGEGEESENTKQPQNEGIEENITETSDTRASAIQLNVAEVIVVICNILSRGDFGTKVAALEWLSHLLMKVPHKSFCHVEKFFPVLLNTLSDESEEVVLLDLEVLAEISSNPAGQFVTEETMQSLSENAQEKTTIARTKSYVGLNVYFSKFMSRLLGLFKKDRQLLEPDERGYFIIRQLCQLLNAEDIFQSFSKITVEEQDVGFACKMVQTLNTILLTSTELFDLRNQLKNLSTQGSCDLFCCLYRSWCHSPVATVSLCYLTQNYQHACELLQNFGDLEITVDFLKEIDKLVQLIESPIFAYLRLQLLDVQRNQELIKSLYGLLMLLPQSEAFKLLRYRLDCIPHYQLATINDQRKSKTSVDQRPLVAKINFKELLKHFQEVQNRHREAKRKLATHVKPRSDSS